MLNRNSCKADTGENPMLVKFKSVETESITMFGDVAIQLIKMLGSSGAIPSAIAAEDIPAAAELLRTQLESHAAGNAEREGATKKRR
jgi:uncharacterized protein DUF1840